jgi:hypothetical protein
MILYARGIAFAVLGRIEEAEIAREKFLLAQKAVPYSRLNSLPSREVDGALEYRKGNFEVPFDHLRPAEGFDDEILYADPPPWLQPSTRTVRAVA